MNRADRVTIARALAEADEQGVTIPSLERYRGRLEATGRALPPTAQTARAARSKPRRDDVPTSARTAVRLRSSGVCEAKTADCTHEAWLVHHIAGRRGPDPHRLENLLHVCNACHLYIHAHPEQSYAEGWMRKRLGAAS